MAATTEERVRERMDRERGELQEQSAEATKRREEACKEHADAKEALAKLEADTVDCDDAEAGAVTDGQRKQIDDAFKRVIRGMSAVISAGNKQSEIRQLLADLDDPAEMQRRLERARELDKLRGPRKPTGKDAAIAILLREGKAMHYREITKSAIESGLIAPKGGTPDATMNAMLAVAAKAEDTFKKVSPGVFDLIDRDAEAKRMAEQGEDEKPAATTEPAKDGAKKGAASKDGTAKATRRSAPKGKGRTPAKAAAAKA